MSRQYCVTELASLVGARLRGPADVLIGGVADISEATSSHITFVGNPKYRKHLKDSAAGAALLPESLVDEAPPSMSLLLHENPSAAFQRLIELFAAEQGPSTYFQGVHPTAVVHETAVISHGVTVAPYAVIDGGAVIGANSYIGPHAYVGARCRIGTGCHLHAGVILREDCVIGNNVILQPGVILGGCGFGYQTTPHGQHLKHRQLGNVIVDDDVEIGAGSTVDRGRFTATKIGQGTKVDNLVQLGHGVTIGKHTLIVAQTGIAGSTKVGDHVTIAGQVAVAGHLTIASGTVIAGKSGVSKSLEKGIYNGIPVQPVHEYNRNAVLLRNIGQIAKRLEQLEKAVLAKEDVASQG